MALRGAKMLRQRLGLEAPNDVDPVKWAKQSAEPAPAVVKAPEAKPEEEIQRSRTDDGKFVGDDPKTPKNEAWKGGKAPKKAAPKSSKAKSPKKK
jgi:hypothetical protein